MNVVRDLRRQWGLIFVIGLSFIAYGGLVRMQWVYGTLRDSYTPQTIGWYLLAFLAFCGGILWLEKRPVSMKWIWITAVLFRLLLLFTTPTLSDDVYRYLWDGYVTNQGVSPYAYAIDAPELDYLDIPQRAQANNSWMASPYLPVAQWVFSGLTFVFPLKPIFMQIVMVGFDLLSGILLTRLLALASLPRHRLFLYLWHPLVIVEVAHGAHIDAWMVLLTLTAVWFTFKPDRQNGTKYGRWATVAAPLFFALATLTKILPILLLPILFWRWSWRQRLFFCLVTAGLLLPSGWRAGWGMTGPPDGKGLFGALRIYSRQWNFNSGLFHWLEVGLARRGVDDPVMTAKWLVLTGMVIVLFVVWVGTRRQRDIRTLLRLTAVPFMAYLLLTTTVHPWYALILLAFLPFVAPDQTEPRRRWLVLLPWLYLSGALVFSYLTYIDPLHFGELEWVRQLEWLPTFALLAVALLSLNSRWQKT